MIFLLVIKGLSRLIIKSKEKGLLRGIKVTPHIFITHLLFVDDVVLFGVGTTVEWHIFQNILNLFCRDTGMIISDAKLSFLEYGLDEETIELIE